MRWDGSGRRPLVTYLPGPLSLTLYNHQLFWSDQFWKELLSLDLTRLAPNATALTANYTVVRAGLSGANSLTVYHESRQPNDGRDNP